MISETALQRIRAVERQIVKNDHETAVAFDTDGNVVFEKVGDTVNVLYTFEDLTKINGSIVTHNHTYDTASEVFGVKGTSSFSSDDLMIAYQQNLIEVRMVVADEVYSFRWDNPDKRKAEIFLYEMSELEKDSDVIIKSAEPRIALALDEYDADPCPRTQLNADKMLTEYYRLQKAQYDKINEFIADNKQIGYTFRKECTQ